MPEMGKMSLEDIAVGGYYGTSALLHKFVELRELEALDPALLRRKPAEIRRVLQQNPAAHVKALAAEHGYLQEKIEQVFGQRAEIGALILANALRRDFVLLVESDEPLPVLEPTEEEEVMHARVLLSRLREMGKEMPE